MRAGAIYRAALSRRCLEGALDARGGETGETDDDGDGIISKFYVGTLEDSLRFQRLAGSG